MINGYEYREFWIMCSREKLIDLSNDLVNDPRVEDFNKLEEEKSDLCKTDAKNVINWFEWMIPILREHYGYNANTVVENRIRLMRLMIDKLKRKIDKSNNGQAT